MASGLWLSFNQGFLCEHDSRFYRARRGQYAKRLSESTRRLAWLGRLEHGTVGSQTGADPARIKTLENMFELVECEMSPGSVLFFHCNLLHSSAANESDYHRRSFIVCYNEWGNPQLDGDKLIRREPCQGGPNDAIV